MFTRLSEKLKNIQISLFINAIKEFTRWKFFPVFVSTFIVFSIVTIQYAESRQYIKKDQLQNSDNVFELEVNRYEKGIHCKRG